MKRTLLVLMCILMLAVFALAGCGKAAEAPAEETKTEAPAETAAAEKPEEPEKSEDGFDPSDKYLGVVCYPSSNTTIAVWMAGFLSTAEELGYQPLYIGGDTTDAATVEQMIDSAIAQYDTLVGVAIAINSETRWNMAKKFTDAGIYVVSVWTAISQDDFATYGVNGDYIIGYHATQPLEYGYEAGKALGEAVGGKGTIAITQNTFNDTENAATEGFTKAIKELYPDIKLLEPQVESADVTTGIGVATSIIQANFSELVGAFGTTGTSPQSWSKAAENTGWTGKIIGMDATSANLDILAAGGCYALVAQPMFDAWAEGAKHLDAVLKGDTATYGFENYVESPVIYADDVDAYRDLLNGIDTYESVFE